MKEKLPALQFYTGDWRKDPCVQALDHEHKGVWIDLLCIMNETAERGRIVLPNGAAMPDDAIARNLGLPEAKWKQMRSKLVELGVASEDESGVLYNRRIVRDQAIREARAEAGRKGGQTSRPKQPESKPEANGEAKRGSSVSVSSSPSGKRARKRALPEEWEPNDAHREKARDLRLELTSEAEEFRNHAKANGRVLLDWDAAFHNWLKKAVEFGRARTNGNGNNPDWWNAI